MHVLPAGRRVCWLQLSVCQRFLHSLSSGDSHRSWRGGSSSAMEIKGRESETQNKDVCVSAVQVCFFVFFILYLGKFDLWTRREAPGGVCEFPPAARSSPPGNSSPPPTASLIEIPCCSQPTRSASRRGKTGSSCLTVSFLPALNVRIYTCALFTLDIHSSFTAAGFQRWKENGNGGKVFPASSAAAARRFPAN